MTAGEWPGRRGVSPFATPLGRGPRSCRWGARTHFQKVEPRPGALRRSLGTRRRIPEPAIGGIGVPV
jgi:hypothetical protein